MVAPRSNEEPVRYLVARFKNVEKIMLPKWATGVVLLGTNFLGNASQRAFRRIVEYVWWNQIKLVSLAPSSL
jgi:hypothetical protein